MALLSLQVIWENPLILQVCDHIIRLRQGVDECSEGVRDEKLVVVLAHFVVPMNNDRSHPGGVVAVVEAKEVAAAIFRERNHPACEASSCLKDVLLLIRVRTQEVADTAVHFTIRGFQPVVTLQRAIAMVLDEELFVLGRQRDAKCLLDALNRRGLKTWSKGRFGKRSGTGINT